MTRVWLVDDELPYDRLTPVADRVEKQGLQYLIDTELTWSADPAVRTLCVELMEEIDVELTALSAPAALTKYVTMGLLPPHVVIFDWEGAGFSNERNVRAIGDTLRHTFAYVQVYTHLDVGTVEVHLDAVREEYPGRLLAARGKHDVNARDLFREARAEYDASIAGEIADEARVRTRRALEEALVELCSYLFTG